MASPLGCLELKRSTRSVTEGIRQNLDSQRKDFICPFFSTVQLLLAGNETEGLRYGAIETPEKYWLRWKEAAAHPAAGDNALLKELGQICAKERLLEIVHDFMVFDAGVKKTCRHNQYFGVRAAQRNVRRGSGGIIWHTQGSGKSLTMVWLAKWIREHVAGARVLIVTDRTELDEQIEAVFKGVSEDIYRTASGTDLVRALGDGTEWLLASLIQKFGASEEGDVEAFVDDLRGHVPRGFRAKGKFFVFVDECHRTQSGKLHDALKEVLPRAALIGFTGTPLLKADKRRSIETFGPYIHTYKYDEAVTDGVVLDLRYEARDVDQNVTSQDRIDQWFELKTRGLTELARAQIKQRWGTMRGLMSSRDRLQKIVDDVVLDMEIRDRLKSGRGNALLVSDSIYSACRFFDMFRQTDLAGKCAIVTSYRPNPADVKGEESGEGPHREAASVRNLSNHARRALRRGERNRDAQGRAVRAGGEAALRRTAGPDEAADRGRQAADRLRRAAGDLPVHRQADAGSWPVPGDLPREPSWTETTRNTATSSTYKDLFRSLERSMKDYTGEAFEGYDAEDVKGLLKDRLAQGRERLEEAREEIKALCEPVEPPHDTTAYLRYFCAAGSGNGERLKENERERLSLYKLTAALLRAYANLANEMSAAGYSESEVQEIKAEVRHYETVRQEVKLASGDYVDMKMYEPAMRHLLDTYVRADESRHVSAFDERPLVRMIVERGAAAVDDLPEGIRNSREAVAETIENNVRRLIIDESAVNPKYYEKMSELLDALVRQRRQEALSYQEYLESVVNLARQAGSPAAGTAYPASIDSGPLRALYDNLKDTELQEQEPGYGGSPPVTVREQRALALDRAIRGVKKADWRGNTFKEREVLNAIRAVLGTDEQPIEAIFEVVKAQHEY